MSITEKENLSDDEREALTADPERQDEAHTKGAYGYLSDSTLAARYSVISGLIEQYDCEQILDIGCYVGGLRGAINRNRAYHGIDISPHAILDARATYGHYERTEFSVGDIRSETLQLPQYPCVVWAGIGFGYSNKDSRSFADLFQKAWSLCNDNGLLIFECIEDYAWVQTHIEATSRLLTAFHVTYSLASLHNRRAVFVARKVLK
ncbi:class I SAM-dependent methyltransferase [Pseudomonas sp. Q12-87]|uniref:class I SAM-dependent methyltransferase n=1 Tax=Pseudomonas sp. Q12-87 TaxID=177989 RepID=UPI00069DE3FB|nr:class I SAM-dependent methyltransferase [Pseudomonas sp. Q12-87]